jgi:hypothetical protein
MSIVVRHQPKGLTREQYDEVSRRMESAGNAWPPEGMDMHVLFGEEGNLRVSEIWDSDEQFRSFYEGLTRVLDEVGVQYSEPEVFQAHELQKRPQTATA